MMTYDDTGVFDTAYTYGVERIGIDILDGTRPDAQNPLYYLYDGQGSVTYVTKPDGEKRDTLTYDEFGKPRTGKLSPDGDKILHTSFGYNGEQWDEEAKLQYLRARYYEPETGRFLSRDTYEGEAENPLSKHLYAYVENNPVDAQDPSGHMRTPDDPEGPSYPKKSAENLFASDKCIKFIQDYEKFEPKMYDASKKHKLADLKNPKTRKKALEEGDWTIGWGHKLFDKEINKYIYKSITKNQANAFFKTDLNKMENTSLKPFLKANEIKLRQYQFDALVSFTYNLGQNFWKDKTRTLVKVILNKDYSTKKIIDAFLAYENDKRRRQEASMFLSASYNSAH